jgi:NAD-dependent dihydropyrimidine dehydrogenase PreA subunit
MLSIFYITDIDETDEFIFLFHHECFDKIAENHRHPLHYMANEDNFAGGDTIAAPHETCHLCKRKFYS